MSIGCRSDGEQKREESKGERHTYSLKLHEGIASRLFRLRVADERNCLDRARPLLTLAQDVLFLEVVREATEEDLQMDARRGEAQG